MVQDILRFRRKASNIYYANYPTQLHYAWRGTHCRSPVVTMLSCVAHRALMMPIHRLHTTPAESYMCNSTAHSQVCCKGSYLQSVAAA